MPHRAQLVTDFGLKKSTDYIPLALVSSVSQAEKTIPGVPGVPVALEGSQAQVVGNQILNQSAEL